MGNLTDISDYLNASTTYGEVVHQHWQMTTGGVALASTGALSLGTGISLWRWDGTPGTGAAIPTSAVACDHTTIGGMSYTQPSGGRQKWITNAVTLVESLLGFFEILLYDRLLHCGGLSGTSVAAQAVGGAITRNTGGVGNKIYAEAYTAVGNTARTITAAYTNQDGNPSTTQPVQLGGNTPRVRNITALMIELPLADGDTGVRSVETATLSASTGTAGNFGITIGRPLLAVQADASLHTAASFLMGPRGSVEIPAGTCLAARIGGDAVSTLFGGTPSVALTLYTVEK